MKRIFLDSGAYTAFTKKESINLEDYIKFIKNNLDHLEVYTNLDCIENAEETLKNQKIIESHGLDPLPCYHYNEDFKYLKYYLDNYGYVALGGMVGARTADLIAWLDQCWKMICKAPDFLPKNKIHGFGVTSPEIIARYPWWSCDSSSWVQYGKYGMILIPKTKKGNRVYDVPPWRLFVSTRSSKIGKEGEFHLNNLSKHYEKYALNYIYEKGFELGKSEFKRVHNLYKLKPNEQWADMKERVVEVVEEKGLCNSHELRDQINLKFFLDLEASVPIWPWAWTKSRKSLI